MNLSRQQIKEFQKIVCSHYSALRDGKILPWREDPQPYYVLVSEFMAQQTFIARVVKKFLFFMELFPQLRDLANAKESEIIRSWQGLGYNRRAIYLLRTARIIQRDHEGCVPQDNKSLLLLPGIGSYTAGAIQAFAYNKAVVFMDTNIRRVFIHHFFSDTQQKIDDKHLIPLIEESMDRDNPRFWYSALMDYGVTLGRSKLPNPNKKSKHYCVQPSFEGSRRQMRGQILRTLTEKLYVRFDELEHGYKQSELLYPIIDSLKKDGLVVSDSDGIRLPD